MQYDLAPQQPAPPMLEGDRRFVGLRMNVPRQYLAEGYYSRAENKRVGFGLETRPGTRTPVFANLNIPGTYFGSGTYFKPAGIELGLLAVDTGAASCVYGIRFGTVPIQISVQTRFSGTVEFQQHFDKVMLHSSNPDQRTMIWDGVNTVDGFVEIADPIQNFCNSGICPSRTHLGRSAMTGGRCFQYRESRIRSGSATAATRHYTIRSGTSSRSIPAQQTVSWASINICGATSLSAKSVA